MPRITIESKINIADSVNEIKTTTYEIPNTIVWENECLSYDSYHKCYTNGAGDVIVPAKEYVFKMIYLSKVGGSNGTKKFNSSKHLNSEETKNNDDTCM